MMVKELINNTIVERDMTPEEMAASEKAQSVVPEPTPEERLNSIEQRTDALESTTDDVILLMAELIGGN